jgi:hypothetical protein
MEYVKIILYYLIVGIPRILCILGALFLCLFSFSGTEEHVNFWKTLLTVTIPIVVPFILILVLSWKWPWIGGICFSLLGIASLIWLDKPPAFVYISLFTMGVLFFLSWFLRKDIRATFDHLDEER